MSEAKPLPDSWYWTGKPERGEYVRAVWRALVDKRGGDDWPQMSSAEWDLACTWLDAGIPLRIVLRGIEDLSGKPKRMTLLYAQPAVERAAAYWRKVMGQ